MCTTLSWDEVFLSVYIYRAPYHHNYRCAAIREGGLELHKLLKETNRKLKVSAGLPEWKIYVDFVNSVVRTGWDAGHRAGGCSYTCFSGEPFLLNQPFEGV